MEEHEVGGGVGCEVVAGVFVEDEEVCGVGGVVFDYFHDGFGGVADVHG